MQKPTKNILRDKNLTVITVSGALTSQKVASLIDDFYTAGCTLDLIWDFRAADMSGVKEKDVVEVIKVAKSHKDQRPRGRTAIVVSRDVDYGISRMYEILCEIKGHTISHLVCRSLDEALAWMRTGSQI